VDRLTVERAIIVTEYFLGHVCAVQSLVGNVKDETDQLADRLRPLGTVPVRKVMRQSRRHDTRAKVLDLFSEWERRGYGEVRYPRKNQAVFAFSEGKGKDGGEAAPDPKGA
jgi:hypothetical protein